VVVPARQSAVPFGRAAAVTPDRTRGRADATLIEASITARLLGMRLLTLDAKVALVPADVTIAGPRSWEPVVQSSALPSGNSRGRTGSVGRGGLADAVRNLNEGAKVLAEVQRRSG